MATRDELNLDSATDQIAKASLNNKLIVFVGAGLSCHAGLPSWGALAKDFVADLGGSEAVGNMSYPDIFEAYEAKHKRLKLLEKIVTAIPNDVAISDAHVHLEKLKPLSIYTTNYDNLLAQTFPTYNRIHSAANVSVHPPSKRIVHLHGHMNDLNSIVITSTDYERVGRTPESSNPLFQALIKSLNCCKLEG